MLSLIGYVDRQGHDPGIRKSHPGVPTTVHAWCQKSCHRNNWLVAAKRSQRRCFLILQCRLFLSLRSRIRLVLDCLPTYRERELGFDRRDLRIVVMPT